MSDHFTTLRSKGLTFKNVASGYTLCYSLVEYLACLLDQNISGESMTKRALKKINGKTKFLYRQNKYLS